MFGLGKFLIKTINKLLLYCYNLESSRDSDRVILFVLYKHGGICISLHLSKEFCIVNQKAIEN